MFGFDQRARLLRESWNADNLAQELYAMFGDTVPNNTQSAVNVNLPTGNTVAPFQAQNIPDGSPIFKITRPNGTTDVFSINGGVPEINGMPISSGGGGGGGSGGVPVWG